MKLTEHSETYPNARCGEQFSDRDCPLFRGFTLGGNPLTFQGGGLILLKLM